MKENNNKKRINKETEKKQNMIARIFSPLVNSVIYLYEPYREKICLPSFRPGPTLCP